MAVTEARSQVPPAPPVRGTSPRRLWIAGAVILAALGFLVFKGLGNATVFFKTADEAVRDKASLGTHRFRVEGVVENWSKAEPAKFDVSNNGAVVHVVFSGTQPELFKNDIPVVLEGRWAGAYYASDRIMVKHTETYRAQNPSRVKDYPADSPTKP